MCVFFPRVNCTMTTLNIVELFLIHSRLTVRFVCPKSTQIKELNIFRIDIHFYTSFLFII